MRQPELARTMRTLADDGPDAYYRGPIGAAIAERLQRAGGFMTADDVAAHAGAWVEPLRATVRGAEILEMPPPTQGVTALEALRIADGLDLGADGPDREHLLIEAMKLALADRDAYVGDPDAMTIAPESLLADDWIAARRGRDRSGARPPGRTRASTPQGGTIYMCTADRDGMLGEPHPVELLRRGLRAARRRVGDQPPQPGVRRSSSTTAIPNGIGAEQDAAAHVDPGAGVARRPALARVRERRAATARRRRTSSCSCACSSTATIRRRAITAPRFTIDPETRSRRDGGPLRSRMDRRPAPAAGTTSTSCPGYRHGPGIAHAIECREPGLPLPVPIRGPRAEPASSLVGGDPQARSLLNQAP